jgi:hypothetical protein
MQCYTCLYTRTTNSGDDRHNRSLKAQEKDCCAYAKRHGLTVTEIVRETRTGTAVRSLRRYSRRRRSWPSKGSSADPVL